jgi:hypothetical protein
VIRLPPDLDWKPTPESFFAPENWGLIKELGRVNPLPLDLADGGSRTALLIVLGRRNAYLLDRAELGGIGPPLAEARVAASGFISPPAAYRAGNDVLVALWVDQPGCPPPPGGQSLDVGVMTLRISSGPQAAMRTEWCDELYGHGAPIVTTSGDVADPIVWIVDADGDNRLHGFRGDNGQEVLKGDPVPGLRDFVTILSAAGRFYVAGDGRVFAFGLPH